MALVLDIQLKINIMKRDEELRNDENLEEQNEPELREELNKHFPLSGNETDEDLDRALEDDETGGVPDRDKLTEEDTERHYPLSGNETDKDL
jgi:hypothetical protein